MNICTFQNPMKGRILCRSHTKCGSLVVLQNFDEGHTTNYLLVLYSFGIKSTSSKPAPYQSSQRGDNRWVKLHIHQISTLKNNELYDPVTGFLKRMPSFSPEELIDRTYLLPPEPDRQHFCAKIVKILKDKGDDILSHPDHVCFWSQVQMDNTRK